MADDDTQTGQNDNDNQDRDRDQNGSGQTGGTPDSGAGYGNNADDDSNLATDEDSAGKSPDSGQ